MAKVTYPVTPAIRALRAAGVVFEPHLYDYEEHGGTAVAARELGVDEHAVIKTLVFLADQAKPLLVLMHGDRSVAPGVLAKAIGAKSVQAATPEAAQKVTGYLVGGISPFGTRTAHLPVYAEQTLFDLESIYINGGKRGFLISLAPNVLTDVLAAVPVVAAQP
ncbi:MAG: Cys-tRNA(Pro) deacylase [Armatimonadaceae bacterium]